MKQICLILLIVLGYLSFLPRGVAAEHATPYEVVKKVEAAVLLLEQTKCADLNKFDQPTSLWVWKDTYLFIIDCSRMTVAAHPVSPELIGKNQSQLCDVNGKPFFSQFCQVGEEGEWIDYFWPRPGSEKASRKISYIKRVPGTDFAVGGGLYEELLEVEELVEFTREMFRSGQLFH
ncbi:MAG: sodium:calcium antiporter [Desulfuromonas sp.]|nr:MAG: sodium:calcium antiporter [Desulfuromonas sp.]